MCWLSAFWRYSSSLCVGIDYYDDIERMELHSPDSPDIPTLRTAVLLLVALVLILQNGCRNSGGLVNEGPRPDTFYQEQLANHSEVATTETIARPLTIDEYVVMGLQRNPAVAEARHKIEAIRHRMP